MTQRIQSLEGSFASAIAARLDRMYADLQALESDCEEVGWRSVGSDVYGARLRISDARETTRRWATESERPEESK